MKRIFYFVVLVLSFFQNAYVAAEAPVISKLDDVIKRAVSSSDRLKLEEKNLEEAHTYLKLQYANYFPKLSVQAAANADLLRTNDFNKDRDTSLSLILDWDMFGNGQIAYSIANAKSQLLRAKVNRRVKESELVFDVTYDYFDLFLKEYNKINLEKNMEVVENEVQQAEIAFKQGNIDSVSLTRTKIKYSDSAIEHSQSSYNLISLLDKLNAKVGCTVSASAVEIDDLVKKMDLIDFDKDVIYQVALQMEPDLLLAKQAKEMAALAAKYAKYKRYPQIQFFTGNSFAVDSVNRDNNQIELRTGMIARYPLFDGGQIKYEIAQAKKNYEKACMEFDQYKDILKKDISDICFTIEKNRKIMQLSEKKIELLKSDIDNTENEYKKGNISLHKWNQLLVDYEKSRFKDFSLKQDYLLSIASLFKKLGNFSIVETDDFLYYLKSFSVDIKNKN